MAMQLPVRADDQTPAVEANGSLVDLLPPEVMSVRTDQGVLITRDQFARVPIPGEFQTNLSSINKGHAAQ